jgi:hypothetical protein
MDCTPAVRHGNGDRFPGMFGVPEWTGIGGQTPISYFLSRCSDVEAFPGPGGGFFAGASTVIEE